MGFNEKLHYYSPKNVNGNRISAMVGPIFNLMITIMINSKRMDIFSAGKTAYTIDALLSKMSYKSRGVQTILQVFLPVPFRAINNYWAGTEMIAHLYTLLSWNMGDVLDRSMDDICLPFHQRKSGMSVNYVN